MRIHAAGKGVAVLCNGVSAAGKGIAVLYNGVSAAGKGVAVPSTIALLRTGTRIFADAADKSGYMGDQVMG